MTHRLAGFMLAAGVLFYTRTYAQAPTRVDPQVDVQARLSFEVASIKPSNSADRRLLFGGDPGHFIVSNVTAKRLIEVAYDIKDFQVSGGPGWIGSDLFDISAKSENAVKRGEMSLMLQSLLADRFHLEIRRAAKELPVYALVVAKNGPKFKDSKESDPHIIDLAARGFPAGGRRPPVWVIRRGRLIAQEADMKGLADQLSRFLGRTVLDKTGLTGNYELKVEWVPDENQVAMFQAIGVPEGFGAPAPDWPGPSLFTALEEQLGLRLESQKGPVEMFVVERVEKPTEN